MNGHIVDGRPQLAKLANHTHCSDFLLVVEASLFIFTACTAATRRTPPITGGYNQTTVIEQQHVDRWPSMAPYGYLRQRAAAWLAAWT